jgi:D-sedoheptulose 7-phosphate isomerase
MAMLEQRIQQQFFESADLHSQAAEALSRPAAQAAQALAACLTAGGKMLAAGSDVGAALAPVICAAFTGRFERERPPLAAFALRAEGAGGALAQQVRALGQPGDVLLLIDTAAPADALLQAADAAHEREMTVLVLTGADALAWGARLAETDVLMAVPHERAARVAETQLLVLHGLCDAVDLQLMGEQECA